MGEATRRPEQAAEAGNLEATHRPGPAADASVTNLFGIKLELIGSRGRRMGSRDGQDKRKGEEATHRPGQAADARGSDATHKPELAADVAWN